MAVLSIKSAGWLHGPGRTVWLGGAIRNFMAWVADGAANTFTVDNLTKITRLTRTDWQGTVALSPSARTNYISHSENISTWAKDWPARTTITTGVSDPQGSNKAITMAASGGLADIYMTHANCSPGVWYASIWCRRRSGAGVVRMNPPDLSASVEISPDSSWREFKLTATTSTTKTLGISISVADGSSIDLVFGQLSDSLGSYIPTTAAPVTVTDYTTSGTTLTLAEAPVKGSDLSLDADLLPHSFLSFNHGGR